MSIQTIGKTADQVGYLLLNELGAIVSSSGDLENDEKFAASIFSLLNITDKIDGINDKGEGFTKMSICFQDFCYIISVSNKRIHVIKRRFTPTVSKPLIPAAEPHLIDLEVLTTNSINT